MARRTRSITLFDRVIETCGDSTFGHHALTDCAVPDVIG